MFLVGKNDQGPGFFAEKLIFWENYVFGRKNDQGPGAGLSGPVRELLDAAGGQNGGREVARTNVGTHPGL